MTPKTYTIEPGLVPYRSVLEAERSPRAWSEAEPCVMVNERRVIYEHCSGRKRPIAVLASRREADGTAVAEVLQSETHEERTVRIADLLTQEQIAELLEVEASTPFQWRSRYDDYPEPVLVVGKTELRLRSEVLEWADRRRPYGRVIPTKS